MSSARGSGGRSPCGLPSRPPCLRTEEVSSDGLKKEPHSPLRTPARQAAIRLPILETLEERIVLSQALPIVVAHSSLPPLLPQVGLVPYKLASGGTAWLQMPGATGVLATEGSPARPATTKPSIPA